MEIHETLTTVTAAERDLCHPAKTKTPTNKQSKAAKARHDCNETETQTR